MTTIDHVEIGLALLTGMLLGVAFFAGLWWTVRQLGSSRHVALLFLISMLFRTSLVIVGFYFILGDDWQRLLAGLVGFIVVRLFATRYIHKTEQSHTAKQKTSYAP
ncbi:MAG: ATP synthase subunit I [Gammaproteobacteria bacterium]